MLSERTEQRRYTWTRQPSHRQNKNDIVLRARTRPAPFKGVRASEAGMFRRLAISLVALSLASASALAADLAYKSAPAPGYDWTGWYAGVGAGYQMGTATGTAVAGASIEPRLWFFGLSGGYRLELANKIVLGIDGSMPVWATTNTFLPAGFGTAILKPQFIIAPEAQIGYAIGSWLPYVGLGVGVADIKGTITPAGGITASDTEFVPEYMITFGLNYALSEHVTTGVRYDHIELDQHNWTFNTAGGPAITQVGGTSDGVTAYVQYKF
jgi:outer membrane immunogenic protein